MKMEIVKNLWQIGGGNLTAPEDAAIYLVRLGQQAALIDSGCGFGHDRLVENISAVLPEDVEIIYLLLTHCHYDHVGGAAALREQYGCKIVAHQLDAAYLEAGDSGVTAAFWYGAKMAALSCPGHSPGSLVYLAEIQNQKVLFGQDVHGPLDPSLLSNREDYIRSLKFIAALNADILCEGHFGVYRGKENIEKFIRSFM
jgi:glyoxylase-like metal-dependent hydrolase (beta-lactamase superfamily II)